MELKTDAQLIKNFKLIKIVYLKGRKEECWYATPGLVECVIKLEHKIYLKLKK